jgi:CRP-like cAMP-binding protein
MASHMAIPAGSDEIGNKLLQRLRERDWAVLQPRLELWDAPIGAVLYRPGDPVEFAYFPRGSSLVSYLAVLGDGRALETGLVGHEGAVGGIVSHGTLPAFARAEVHFGGSFFRIGLEELEEAKADAISVRYLLSRYADCQLAQAFTSVACNAVHSLEQRAARWLLGAGIRTGTGEVALTQQQLAAMLGVGRSYLSRIIQAFQQNNFIKTGRGRITLLDLDGLRSRECECNNKVRAHFDVVLEGLYPDESLRLSSRRT